MNRPDFICFDSLSEEFKSPLGAVRAGEELRLSLRLPKRSGARSPRLLVYAADRWESPLLISPMTLLRDEPAQVWYTVRFTPPAPALLFYRFDVDLGGRRASVLRGKNLFEGGMGDGFSEHWQLTVCDPEMKPPAALAGGLLYQIFPDRFFASGQPKRDVPQDRELRADWGGEPRWRPDSDGKVRCGDYFGGDLEGIRQKLPYLESLGVTALYLNPIFEAHSNHRYNTADYRKIDPLLGGEQDLRRLCAEAKACGISVILDGVFSHTGSDSTVRGARVKRAATTCRSRKAALLRLYTTPRLSALENRRRADCHAGLITDSQWRQMLLPRPILPSPSCLCEPAPLHLCGNPYPLPSAPFLFIAAVFLQTTGSASGLQYTKKRSLRERFS